MYITHITGNHAKIISVRLPNSVKIRGAPDPEFCYLAVSGSRPDPDMSDPAGSGSEPDPNYLDPAGSGSKPDNRRKITLSAAQLEETGMTVYPVL